MAILLFAEHDGTTLSPETAKALTAARALGGPVDLLVAGENVGAVAAATARLEGLREVILAEAPGLAHRLAEPCAALIEELASGYDAILAPAGSTGKSVLPRVAARLDVMQVSEVIEVLSPDSFRRPIYAGNAIEVVQSEELVKVLTIRTAAFVATPDTTEPAPIRYYTPSSQPSLSRHLETRTSQSDRPDLGSARIVVSGGRALGSAERFREVLRPVADRLGAAMGASRAAVDAGYAPNDLQVGQTGKVVAPELYFACGISGAIQHLAGMKDSKVIVAINRDEDAPIFQVADYGLVGDLFEILPDLERQL